MSIVTRTPPNPDFEVLTDDESPIAVEPFIEPDFTPNPLFENLIPAIPQTRTLNDKLTFAQAMPRMGMSSVFDIIRQPKGEFARQLRTLSDADGELAYDNALCYATQIARSYREDVVSSGRDLPLIAPQTGVRALVDIGPSYPNLFKENWDQFCKVGAIEAMDGPVAYLASLRRFAAQKIEGASTSPQRIPLAVRRPDLDTLVVDEQSTYQSRPMLDLVNDVLIQGIDKYQTEKGDERPVHQLLAEKKHPFVFPYHFAHQQVSLALGGDKLALGEIANALGMLNNGPSSIQKDALEQLSDLSPAQQRLLLQSSPFAALTRTLGGELWHSPVQSNIYPWAASSTWFDVPQQASVSSVTHQSSYTSIAMTVSQGTSTKTIKLRAHSLREDTGGSWRLSQTHADIANGVCLRIDYHPEDNDNQPLEGEFHAPLVIDVMVKTNDWTRIGRRLSVDISTGNIDQHSRNLTPEQSLFFSEHYGIEQTSLGHSVLSDVNTLCKQSGLDADELQSLIAQKDAFPRLSPNCPIGNPTGANKPERRMPHPMNYGAIYVNGTGGQDRYKPGANEEQYNNGLTFWRQSDTSALSLGNTCLDRFDRLQRMIRLQRWMNLPFAELDTLIISAMRSEGDANPGLQLNRNTLRTLGAYRYFNRHRGIGAEAFAALLHDITPFACGAEQPLFDRVFNSPVLFGEPLQLDQAAFTQQPDDPASQKTVGQLCAGLGLLPDESSFCLAAANTVAHVGPLTRSLPVVSALYRQARIAGMFGLSIADLDFLLRLLGGDEFVRKCTAGVLLPRETEADVEPDVLDILMQLDQQVRWMTANKVDVTQLRSRMANATQEPASAGLLEQLQQLASDLRNLAVTPARIAALELPATAAGTTIDWHAKLAGALIDAYDLVIGPQLTVNDTGTAPLTARVTDVVTPLGLAPADVTPVIARLSDFLEVTWHQQTRLLEGFLQAFTGLLPEQAKLVGHWTYALPQLLPVRALRTWAEDGAQDDASLSALLVEVGRVRQCAEIIHWAGTGARALRTFKVCPDWLGVEAVYPHSLASLRLLKAYDTLFNTLGQPEERLLGYLELANTAVSKRPGKRQLALQAQTSNAALAELLGWQESEVAVLTASLPQRTAKTIAHIDWLRRAQALALETGLNAATLLQACALNADSPDAEWQAVGQAAMAALR